MEECKDPTCVFSLKTKKCVKPNPYIQFLPQCKKFNLYLDECKKKYKLNIDDIKRNACNYYRENIENKKNHKASCPKSRRPINDICPENYPILKNNKHNIQCCYKSTKKPIEENKPSSNHSDSKPSSNHSDSKPSSNHSESKPSSKHSESKQSSKHTESKQSSKHTESKPSSNRSDSKPSSNHMQIVARKNTPLNEIKMPNRDDYINKKTKKYIRLLKRYQNRLKPIK
jgi:hypothetical protein